MDEDQNRAIALYEFLKALTELRFKTVRSIEQYETVLWFSDIPKEEGCYCAAWHLGSEGGASETWVEVKKPRLKAPPSPPLELQPWLPQEQILDSTGDTPELHREITITTSVEKTEKGVPVEKTEIKRLEERPEVESIWEHYVEEKWWPWAEEDRRLQAVQKVYTELFSIYQKQQRLGEQYEVVLGLGLLAWKTPDTQEIKRHLLIAQTSLTFDSVRGVISLGPAGEGAKLAFEQDMIDPQYRPSPEEIRALEGQIAEIGDELWEGIKVSVALTGWTNSIPEFPRSRFEPILTPPDAGSSDPVVHLAPAIILRQRTERSFIRTFGEIIGQLKAGTPVPPGVQRFVSSADGVSDIGGRDQRDREITSLHGEPQEIYFPLEANQEQRKIIERLETHQGVLVQGPPGTGKSHTIVNLICHLLATGQRVLVTSHTARALQVLRQYLKERVSEISPLCVVLLGDDRNALQAMEDSVQGITDRYNVRSAERSVQHIEELKKGLDEARREEAILRQEICAIREAETYRHPPRFGDYQGTAQAIAIRLSQEALQYSWFRDRPADEELPITEPEAVEFLYLLRNTELDRAEEATWIPVNPEGLFLPQGFSVLVRQEEEARKIYDETNRGRDYPAYQYLKSSPEETRGRVADGLSVLVRDFESLVGHIQSWIKDAAREILADQDRHWRELLEVTQTHLNILADRARWADGIQVSEIGRDLRVVRSDAEVLLAHLEKGGKLGWGLFRPKPVKQGLYLIQGVRVDGRLCDRPEVLRDLISYLEVRERIEALRAQWSEYVQISSPSLSRQVAQYHDLCEPLGAALDLHRKMVEIRGIIAEIPGLVEPVWHDIEALKALLGATEAAHAEERLREAIQAIDKVEEKLRRVVVREKIDPAAVMLLEAVRSRNQEGYARAYEILAGHYTVRQELERRKVLLEKFEEVVPHLSTELSSTADDPTWDERMKQLGAAWNWVRATVWIKRLGDPSAIEQLNLQLGSCHRQIRNLLGKLAAEKAWDHCLAKMKEHEREHLVLLGRNI